MSDHDELGSFVGDARKRLTDPLPPNHDEIHAHADVDWTGPNIVLGEE